MKRPVLITGSGAITAISASQDELVESVMSGKTGMSEVFAGVAGLRSPLGARVPDDWLYRLRDHASLDLEGDRCLLLALAAASQATADMPRHEPVALCIGLAGAEMARVRLGYQRVIEGGTPDPESLLRTAGGVASALARRLGLVRGFVEVHQNACAAGLTAIGAAADLIRQGHVERAIAGGAETLDYGIHAGFDVIRALDRTACRPFDQHRSGTVLGEGAAFVLLESEAAAARRGARPIARLAGYGMSNDAFHRTRPDPSGFGQLSAMEAALRDAGVTSTSVDAVYAHGTGTPANDEVELRALSGLLGDNASATPIASIKGATGHTVAASGALNVALAIMTLQHGIFAGNIGLRTPIDGYREWCLPQAPIECSARTILVNAFAFGGNNGAAVISAP